jgi:hypothetical protein
MSLRWWLVIALVTGCEKESQKPCTGETTVDDVAVTCCDAGRHYVRVAWAELEDIEITTTDRGPVEEDLFWHLRAAGHECVISNGRIDDTHLYDHLRTLPGMTADSYGRIIEATGSTANARFPIWQRSGRR